jgi:hypothetical protein
MSAVDAGPVTAPVALAPVSQSIIETVDQVLDESDSCDTARLADEVLSRFGSYNREKLLKETLRVFVEVRLCERTGSPTVTRTESDKVRENRLRRAATRQGEILVKSRRRDRLAQDYGLYVLVDDKAGNRIGQLGGQAAISAFANGEGMTLDEVDATLAGRG